MTGRRCDIHRARARTSTGMIRAVRRRLAASQIPEKPSGAELQRQGFNARGRHVAFHSWAPNLVPGDTNAVQDLFVAERDH